ncbi:MAG TPA: VOC family protein [Mycobacteriales bacterium]|jgi:PhnB protein|nr:VOC family protein [Mycobacteriales bacterium]
MSIEPWLSVPDGERAIAFYVEAFDARVLERLEGDHGGADIAQFAVAGGQFWIQRDPDVRPSGARFLLLVPDPEAAYSRAVAAGAVEVAAVHEEHGWVTGRVTDPFGFDWELSRKV